MTYDNLAYAIYEDDDDEGYDVYFNEDLTANYAQQCGCAWDEPEED